MRLNPNVNVPAFLEAVRSCRGEVSFVTSEGDILNLKSALSQFVFTAVVAGKLTELEGHITVQNSGDEELLYPYCMRES